MIYDVTHRTTYRYLSEVSVSHHFLRLTPRSRDGQSMSQHDLEISPPPAVVSPRTDYFGNSARFVTVERPHRTLEITARSRVALTPPKTPAPEATPCWEDVSTQCGIGGALAADAGEFAFESPLIRRDARLAVYATGSFPARCPVLEGALALTKQIFTDFRFDPKATTVATPVEEVFQARRGVCQDFAQFQIACFRSLGLPARYVSGYLETVPPPGRARLVGADASHAWVQVFCGEAGWVDLDPTNNLLPGERHIVVAWGRDFGDVSPVRGVVVGSGGEELEVSVDVSPVSAAVEHTGA